MEWYLSVVRDNYANFSGRARRKEYWMFLLFNILFSMAAIVVDFLLGTYMILYAIYLLAMIIPGFAVTIRRVHDLNKSGWWILINLIPLIGPIWFLVLTLTNGTDGNNDYGRSPK